MVCNYELDSVRFQTDQTTAVLVSLDQAAGLFV
jgi:hypothetical protein